MGNLIGKILSKFIKIFRLEIETEYLTIKGMEIIMPKDTKRHHVVIIYDVKKEKEKVYIDDFTVLNKYEKH